MPHDVTSSPFLDKYASLCAPSFNFFNQSALMELFQGFISVSRQHKTVCCSVVNAVAFYSQSLMYFAG